MKKRSLKSRILQIGVQMIVTGVLVQATDQIFFGLMKGAQRKAENAVELQVHLDATYQHFIAMNSHMRGILLNPEDQIEHSGKKREEEKVKESLQQVFKHSSDPEITKSLNEIKEIEDKQLKIIENQILSLVPRDLKAAQDLYTKEYMPINNKIDDLILKIKLNSREFALTFRKEADQYLQIAGWSLAGLLLVSTLIGVWQSWRLANSASAELEEINEHITEAADNVEKVSLQISTTSEDLSESTTQQASSIEETVSSMEQMASMLAQTSNNSQAMMNITEDGRQKAQEGSAVIGKLMNAMDEIHTANSKLEAIVKIIDEIKSKTNVINDIVFETRLLSFNASIEAARAGAHGKGFAVVAEEVGKLAQMSGRAAEEIRALLESSTVEVSNAVRSTQERVHVGRGISQECETTFNAMGRTLERIAESARSITAATKEQEGGVRQTNRAMNEMDKVTQKNANASVGLANQGTALSEGAMTLAESIEHLKNVIFGSDGEKYSSGKNHISAHHPKRAKLVVKRADKKSRLEGAQKQMQEAKENRTQKSDKTVLVADRENDLNLDPSTENSGKSDGLSEIGRTDSRWKSAS